MFERFSDRAKRPLFVSYQNARRDGSKLIEPHHILHALLDGPDPTVRNLLVRLGVAPDRIRLLLPVIPLTAAEPTQREIPFSEETKLALALAVAEADELKHARLGTGHLLLGLLRAEAAAARGPLTQSGVNVAAARGLVMEVGRGLQQMVWLRRRRENASLAVMALVIITVLLGLVATGRILHGVPVAAWGAMLVAVFGQLVFSTFNSRCPACDGSLGRLIRTAGYCPHCGIELTSCEESSRFGVWVAKSSSGGQP